MLSDAAHFQHAENHHSQLHDFEAWIENQVLIGKGNQGKQADDDRQPDPPRSVIVTRAE